MGSEGKGGRHIFTSGNSAHPNLLPSLVMIKRTDCLCIIYPWMKFTLMDSVMFSPGLLTSSSAKCLFVVYQLLHLIQKCHSLGLSIGELTLSDITVTEGLWLLVDATAMLKLPVLEETKEKLSYAGTHYTLLRKGTKINCVRKLNEFLTCCMCCKINLKC